MQKKDTDILKYVEKVMNEDRLFNDIKMVLSAGYIATYMCLRKGEKGKAEEVAGILRELGRDCAPHIKRAMELIREHYKEEPKQ
jgi:hypothetical protein